MTNTKTDPDFAALWEEARVAIHRVASGQYYRDNVGPTTRFDKQLAARRPYSWAVPSQYELVEFDEEDQRKWFVRISQTFELHPVIERVVRDGYRPVDWQRMLLEWPHVSTEDETQIAYTRDEKSGEDFLENGSKRQVRCKIGKYLSRHYPHIPDEVRRDWAGRFSPGTYEIWDTMEKVIAGIELGPTSCMHSANGNHGFTSNDNYELSEYFNGNTDRRVPWTKHPYSVYDPKYGWRMAVRIDKGNPNIVMARALINVDPEYLSVGQAGIFVRVYGRGSDDSKLGTWLGDHGYVHESSWPDGVCLAKVRNPNGGYLMPYIDGDTQTVTDCGSHYEISEDGEIEATGTCGTVDGTSSVGTCDDCGATVHENEKYIHAGRYENHLVCECCRENYTYVEGCGSRGQTIEYYVHDDNRVEVNGSYYDEDNLPSNIVQLHDGEWYLRDDSDIVECADDKWRLKDDCWESAEGNWYSDSEAQIDVAGGTYHPDELQDKIDNA